MLFSLSGLNLKLQDLPVCLLSRLQSLESWDLSRNQLQELPQNLNLPALRFLDLSDNQLEDVTGLESLQHLEELKMGDNLYITVRKPTLKMLQRLEDFAFLWSATNQSEISVFSLLFYQISDHYKLMVLLPRLMMFNGKNVSTTATHLRYAYTENLRTRVSFFRHFNDIEMVVWLLLCILIRSPTFISL